MITLTVPRPFADVFDADVASYIDSDGYLHYIGTPFSNARLSFARITESWSSLSHTDMGKRFQRWTSGELSLNYANDVMWSTIQLGCTRCYDSCFIGLLRLCIFILFSDTQIYK